MIIISNGNVLEWLFPEYFNLYLVLHFKNPLLYLHSKTLRLFFFEKCYHCQGNTKYF